MKNWTAELEKITEEFVSNFRTFSDEQLNWKSNSKSWSIAQNIEHLIVFNETYYPVFTSLKDGTYKFPFIARIGFIVSFFGKTVLNAVKPDRKKKMKTFPIWEPSVSQFSSDILSRFGKHQKELKLKIEDSKILVEKGTIISSPANKNIVYKLETAFDIIISHEQRHFEQAMEVLGQLRSNTRL